MKEPSTDEACRDATPVELTTAIANEANAIAKEKAREEAKTEEPKEEKEVAKEEDDKPKSDFKYTPITFDKASSTSPKPVVPVAPKEGVAVSDDAEKAIERA